jgi:hypothetical protein
MDTETYQAILQLAGELFPGLPDDVSVLTSRFPLPTVTAAVTGAPFELVRLHTYRLPDGRPVGLGFSRAGNLLAVDLSGLGEME